MSETQISPISTGERLEIIDVLRGLAIGGILIGNMQWFSGFGNIPAAVVEQGPVIDRITHFLIHFLVEGKFYSIFSFLFGFGFALQIARAEERGDLKARLFKRRLLWLLVIGLLHTYLLWSGDILTIYALMGFVLILFRRKSNESLLKWTLALIVVPILSYLLLYLLFAYLAPPDTGQMIQNMQYKAWSEGKQNVPNYNYWQIISEYNIGNTIGRYLGLILQMRLPKILAMFLLGFYAYRKGFFQNLSQHRQFIGKVLSYGLVIGVTGNLLFSGLAGNEAAIPPTPAGIVGVIAYGFGVPALALFYIAVIATLWQKNAWQKVLSPLAPVGRMALTNYLMQTVICVFLFYGFGFGLFGKLGAATVTLIALSIFVVQIFTSSLWLKYFKYGPVEWVWRQLTYRQRLSLLKEIK